MEESKVYKKRKFNIKKVLLTLIAAIISIFFVAPLILTITNSFMTEHEINMNYDMISFNSNAHDKVKNNNEYVNLKIVPDMVTLSQYYNVLVKQIKFLFMFWNSAKIAFCVILGQVIIASMAAYAFSKLEFPGRNKLFFLYIITMLMPFQVTLLPNYIVADMLNLIDTHSAIILPGVFSAFGVFLLRQFMMDIPKEYIEAAMMDGAGQFYIFTKIIIPISINSIAALTILAFIDNWNLIEQPLILLKDQLKEPLSLYLSQINANEKGIAFAASTLYMIPALLIFLYAESYLIEGIKNSGIKG